MRHSQKVFLWMLGSGAPAVLCSLVFLERTEMDPALRRTIELVVLLAWLIGSAVVRENVVRPLQTLSNMLAALREGDFSTRGRGARPDDALGLALREATMLTTTLREERLGALESAALLRTVMSEIDVAVFAFDAANRLRLVNRAGERLLASPAERLLGRTLTLSQGSYNPGGDPTSAGTHDGGGVVDISVDGMTAATRTAVARVLREVGFAAWVRNPSQGDWPWHIHAAAINDTDLSSQAQHQIGDYYLGLNGLANHAPDDGPRIPILTWEEYQRQQ